MSVKMVKDPVRYKTVLCNKWSESGRCPYGPRCQFAHGESELRQRQPAKLAMERTGSQERVSAHKRPAVGASVSARKGPAVGQSSLGPESREVNLPLEPAQQLMSSHATFESARSDSPCSPFEEEVADTLPLHVDSIGQVVCRRDASYTTQAVRRQLSQLLAEDSDKGSLSEWSLSKSNNPFGFPWISTSVGRIAPLALPGIMA